jgi:REP element-mobilizing transposase RayT
MNRGAARQTTFHSDLDRLEFERLLGVGHRRVGVEVHAYCLMGNHFHLIVHCPDGGLSASMHQLGSVFTRHSNERSGRDGPLFRGRFHSIPIHTPDYRIQAVRYIHRNPLDIDPALSLNRYRWSSHRVYVGNRVAPFWMRTDEILESFGGDRDAFDRFVTGHDRSTAPYDAQSPPFADNLKAVVDLVVDEFNDPQGVVRQGLNRTVSLLLLGEAHDLDDPRLAAEFGFGSVRALKEAVWRARRRASAQPAASELAVRAARLVA